ncbi:hypothetical protein Rumeso_02475 [Rubellimicrobium mesophilum DSM 19309]|uniref:Uncharacterized protein n=1 Tax=Rubellimicrobium mesophilum DSM 19309 TaxID=442562 RepID=A0A017HNX7_9RHOB|nr:hypothetical protein [Rubellimicrobium mesophilum]EYD76046.1 hypothetical protein Rumeso_02475 [Rubellimicrobium mesophilum DSM 19309]
MTQQHARLVAELTAQEEAEIVALEASIRNIHWLTTSDAESARRAAKSIRSSRMEAERGLETLRAVNIGTLDASNQRDYLVQVETFTRTLAAVNRAQPLRPM